MIQSQRQQVTGRPNRVEELHFAFDVIASQQSSDAADLTPDRQLLAIRQNLLPDLDDLLTQWGADTKDIKVSSLELNLGDFALPPDWTEVRRRFQDALRSALSPYLHNAQAVPSAPSAAPVNIAIVRDDDQRSDNDIWQLPQALHALTQGHPKGGWDTTSARLLPLLNTRLVNALAQSHGLAKKPNNQKQRVSWLNTLLQNLNLDASTDHGRDAMAAFLQTLRPDARQQLTTAYDLPSWPSTAAKRAAWSHDLATAIRDEVQQAAVRKPQAATQSVDQTSLAALLSQLAIAAGVTPPTNEQISAIAARLTGRRLSKRSLDFDPGQPDAVRAWTNGDPVRVRTALSQMSDNQLSKLIDARVGKNAAALRQSITALKDLPNPTAARRQVAEALLLRQPIDMDTARAAGKAKEPDRSEVMPLQVEQTLRGLLTRLAPDKVAGNTPLSVDEVEPAGRTSSDRSVALSQAPTQGPSAHKTGDEAVISDAPALPEDIAASAANDESDETKFGMEQALRDTKAQRASNAVDQPVPPADTSSSDSGQVLQSAVPTTDQGAEPERENRAEDDHKGKQARADQDTGTDQPAIIGSSPASDAERTNIPATSTGPQKSQINPLIENWNTEITPEPIHNGRPIPSHPTVEADGTTHQSITGSEHDEHEPPNTAADGNQKIHHDEPSKAAPNTDNKIVSPATTVDDESDLSVVFDAITNANNADLRKSFALVWSLIGPQQTSATDNQSAFWLKSLGVGMSQEDADFEPSLTAFIHATLAGAENHIVTLRTAIARLDYGAHQDANLRQKMLPVFESVLQSLAPENGAQPATLAQQGSAAATALTETSSKRQISHCAGLVLFHPYIKMLFDRSEIEINKRGIIPAHLGRAASMLGGLVNAAPAVDAPIDPLERILLGQAVDAPVPQRPGLSADDTALIDGLIRSVIAQWGRLGTTSPDGLRASFIARDGLLDLDGTDMDTLVVNDGPYDVLLDALPWSFNLIRLPWMPRPLSVKWRGSDD